MNILSPEKNINYLKHYHRSSKIMLPLVGVSALLEYFNNDTLIYKNNSNEMSEEDSGVTMAETDYKESVKVVENKYKHLNNYVHMANVLNIGYHSYLSTSCILTDYVKNVKLEKISRVVSAKSHVLGILGLGYYLFNRTK